MINSRYILQKKLGQGRSTVYSVIDTEFPEREVAAKFLPISTTEEEKISFREEYFKLNKLDHPNIIKAYEYGKVFELDAEDTDINLNSLFFTLEHFSSLELLNYPYIHDEKKLRIIIKQICSVLYYLHLSNYIYYDLKPENILVSEINGIPQIKIIDLGLSDHKIIEKEFAIRGTAYYIAPELLKREEHNHSVDLYSLGMILYRIVFKKFPFNKTSELEIYKAHIEQKFEFPEADYSEDLIDVIKKLLEKEPLKRYNNALQILNDLGEKIDIDLTQNFLPAKVLSGRKDALNIVGTYLKDANSNEVFAVRGFDGSGKTALLQEVYQKYQFAVSIDNTKTKSGLEAIKYIFKKLAFSESIYPQLNEEQRDIIKQILNTEPVNISDSLKRFFSQLNNINDILLLFDDFNLYDNYSADILIEIMPILQVKKVKVIVSESSDHDYKANKINNLQEIQLTQLTEYQLTELLDLSYYEQFPKSGLKKIILLYADLLPGNIKQFIKDIIILKVMRFNAKGVEFVTNEEIDLVLQSTNEEIYRLRLSNISAEELKLAQIISTFQVSVEQTILAALMDISIIKLKNLLENLVQKNIIDPLNLSNAPQINSDSFKKYIYSTINNVKKVHIVIANSINRLFPDFNPVELSRQFELASEYEKSAEVLKREIEKAEKVSSYGYKRSLLEHLLQLDLKPVKLTELKIELVKTLYKLSDYKSALEYVDRIDLKEFKKDVAEEILFIKGSSLIAIGQADEGKSLLNELTDNLINKSLENKVVIEMALSEFDIGNHQRASNLIQSFIENKQLSFEENGKCYNLLGMCKFLGENDVESALKYFELSINFYENALLPGKVAGIIQNMGIIYYEKGDIKKAREQWENALGINKKIGNLEQEAILNLNFGVNYLRRREYEEASPKFYDALNIFSALGNRYNLGIVLLNLGELHLELCEYQNAYESLTESQKILSELKSKEELHTLFLFAKFWYEVGNTSELQKTINKFEKLLDILPNVEKYNFITLRFIQLFLIKSENTKLESAEIQKLLSEVEKENVENLYIDLIFILVDALINEKKLDYAINLLNDSKFETQIEGMNYYEAKRLYYLGILAKEQYSKILGSSIDYFEQSFKLLENDNISELTWKVLMEIAIIYWERGNSFKSKKPRAYAEELLSMIYEHIRINKVRKFYLNKLERKNAQLILKKISDNEKVYEFQKN